MKTDIKSLPSAPGRDTTPVTCLPKSTYKVSAMLHIVNVQDYLNLTVYNKLKVTV